MYAMRKIAGAILYAMTLGCDEPSSSVYTTIRSMVCRPTVVEHGRFACHTPLPRHMRTDTIAQSFDDRLLNQAMQSHITRVASATQGSSRKQTNLLNARTLIRLRWFAILAQLIVGPVAGLILHLPVRLGDFLIVIAAEVLFNLVAILLLRQDQEPTERWLLGSIAFDIIAFTNLIFVSGGPSNPFTALYIVNVAIAASMLTPKRIAWIVLLASVGYGTLFLTPSSIFAFEHPEYIQHMDAHPDGFHLLGMWGAHVITSIAVAFFTGRLNLDRRTLNNHAMVAAVQTERAHRLSSLAALAAGATHEIATPLSTIAVVASDLEDAAHQLPEFQELAEDAALIGQEVKRCRAILDRMAIESGYIRGGSIQENALHDFLNNVMQRVHRREQIILDNQIETPLISTQFNTAMEHAVTAVLNNATLAGPSPVSFLVERRDHNVILEITDKGVGIAPDVLTHVTEPFFTTRETGKGMGLGLFLAYSVAHSLNAQFEIESEVGQGTRVRFTLFMV